MFAVLARDLPSTYLGARMITWIDTHVVVRFLSTLPPGCRWLEGGELYVELRGHATGHGEPGPQRDQHYMKTTQIIFVRISSRLIKLV